MCIHVRPVDYAATTFPQSGRWDLSELPDALASRVVVVSVTTAPEGKHSLDECPRYEQQWRKHAPEVISLLTGTERVCFVWALGPMEPDGLLGVYRHLGPADQGAARYHIPEVTSLAAVGYRSSWISFEFEKKRFTELIGDEELDLEFTRLYGLAFEPGLTQDVVTKPFDGIGLSWILKHDAVALAPHRHFEGYYVLGIDTVIARSLDRVTGDARPTGRGGGSAN